MLYGGLDMTGLQLRKHREQAGVTTGDLAAAIENRHGALGVASSWISQLEARRRVTKKAEGRYLAALARLTAADPDGLATSGHGEAA